MHLAEEKISWGCCQYIKRLAFMKGGDLLQQLTDCHILTHSVKFQVL